MSTIDLLTSKAEKLPEPLQREAVDFVDYLLRKIETNTDEVKEWSGFSMQNAIRGFEDDPVFYTKEDIKQ